MGVNNAANNNPVWPSPAPAAAAAVPVSASAPAPFCAVFWAFNEHFITV